MKRRPPPPAGPAVNITSLCDIMLSLLIFFMLVSKAGVDTGADPELSKKLPMARLGITEEDVAAEKKAGSTLVLNVDASGIAENPRVYGKLTSTGKEFSHNVVDPATQRPELREFVREIGKGRDDFVVAIHAASGTPFFDVQPVLQAVNGAKPAQVRFAFNSR